MSQAVADESQPTTRRTVSVFAELVLDVPDQMTDEEIAAVIGDHLMWNDPPGMSLVDQSITDIQS